MSAFPLLKTGAACQYPAPRALKFSTEVIRFLDGGTQRFRGYASAGRRWVIRLDLLTEPELATMEEFFAGQQGRLGSFSFTDPRDGTVHTNCSFDSDIASFSLDDVQSGATELAIRENRS
ncbi:MAG: hypothetical protein FJW39_03730 [Acidobacteria bacterium]|nr:hypothetical protein [Acidobacteriota bacterium]